MRLISVVAGPDLKARDAARGALAAWVEREPGFAPAQMGMGISLALAGDLDAARAHFERAVKLDPKLAAAWSNLGNVHKMQGRLKDARRAYEHAIDLDPALADAHYNLAQVFDLQGDTRKATESLRRALLFRPAYGEAHNNLGHLMLKSGKVDEACSHFRQALVFQPQLRPARFNLVLALYRLGRTVEAQSEVDKLLAETPDDPQVLRVQAAGLAQQGRLEDAEAVNRRLMAREPDAADLQFNLGEVLLSRQDHEAALSVYRELLGKRGVPPAVVIGAMANVTLAQGKLTEAQTLYRQALMNDGSRAMLALGLGRAQIAGGDVKLGLEAVRRAVDLAPEASDLHAALIDLLRFERDGGMRLRTEEWTRWRTRHGRGATAPARSGRKSSAPTNVAARVKGDAWRVGLIVGEPQGAVLAALQALGAQQAGPNEPAITWHVYASGSVNARSHHLAQTFDHWRPIAALGTDDLVAQWRADGIDVLVDTVGLAGGTRAQALMRTQGPRRIAWAGLLGDEVPSPPVDVIVGDAVTQGAQALLQSLYPWAPAQDDTGRARDGLAGADTPATPERFTFGGVAAWSHIQDAVLDTWAEILLACGQARLVLVTDVAEQDEALQGRLAKLLALRDVDPSRIETRGLPRSGGPESRALAARLRGVDCVLDTFPVPMGPAAFDVLDAGVPVVTLAGAAAWQRSTASALTAVGHAADIAVDRTDYVRLARAHHTQGPLSPGARRSMRDALRAQPQVMPIPWTQHFVRALLKAADVPTRT